MTPENLVVGGGLAGAMAGLRLARAGRSVVLLEKEPGAHHKVCGEFLSPEAVSYLRQAGLDPLRLGAAEIARLRFSVKDRLMETELPFRALSLSRCVLESRAKAAAGRRAWPTEPRCRPATCFWRPASTMCAAGTGLRAGRATWSDSRCTGDCAPMPLNKCAVSWTCFCLQAVTEAWRWSREAPRTCAS